ncbi:hypothetical protein PG996_004259 [Apiospora saccharicola]|uniref:Uncharacterized protein n=1 Tax=Apiospora saccharicola TaxID=335842 RepID=A0ABR1W3M6_9PEZI
MCQTIVAHHYACGHTVRQYFENDPICLPGPDLCARVGPLRHHHFYWNQVTDCPGPLHETNHRYGLCDVCAAHVYHREHTRSGVFRIPDPWMCFLKTDNFARQSGFAEHEDRCLAAEAAVQANNPVAGWCPELLPAVTARLDQILWDAPEGVP